jgi:hypothetical protein
MRVTLQHALRLLDEPGMKDNLHGLLKAVLVPVGIVLLVLLMVLFGTGS